MGFEDLHNQFQAQTHVPTSHRCPACWQYHPPDSTLSEIPGGLHPVIQNRTQTAAIFFADHRKRCAVGGKNSIMVPVMKKM